MPSLAVESPHVTCANSPPMAMSQGASEDRNALRSSNRSATASSMSPDKRTRASLGLALVLQARVASAKRPWTLTKISPAITTS
jgi:hypothetical protein